LFIAVPRLAGILDPRNTEEANPIERISIQAALAMTNAVNAASPRSSLGSSG
jgi:hypothetical protein